MKGITDEDNLCYNLTLLVHSDKTGKEEGENSFFSPACSFVMKRYTSIYILLKFETIKSSLLG
jgi:hypothetical protein